LDGFRIVHDKNKSLNFAIIVYVIITATPIVTNTVLCIFHHCPSYSRSTH
jgi:hypothetical protein